MYFIYHVTIVTRTVKNIRYDAEDFCGGVESIMNPQDSEDRIREAILKR